MYLLHLKPNQLCKNPKYFIYLCFFQNAYIIEENCIKMIKGIQKWVSFFMFTLRRNFH